MTRNEFCTDEVVQKIKFTYELFLEMQDKYRHQVQREQHYNFTFYDWNGTGSIITMTSNKFMIFDERQDGDDCPVFIIEEFDTEHPNMRYTNLEGDYFTFCDAEALTLEIGDSKDWNKRYVNLDNHSWSDDDLREELYETYTEEYFFQQLTVQNIMPYEDFRLQVDWFYDSLSQLAIANNHFICVNYIDKFQLKALEGFKII